MGKVDCNLVESLRQGGLVDRGLLLGSSVSNPQDSLKRSVILVFNFSPSSLLGLQINRVLPQVSLSSIVENLGFEVSSLEKGSQVYYGGSIGSNRLHFIHSLDWFGISTIKLSNQVGITSDLGILSAFSLGQGPSKFRACAGNWRWDLDTLRDQIFHLDPECDSVSHRWEVAPVRGDLVFDSDSDHQWEQILRVSAQMQCSRFFN